MNGYSISDMMKHFIFLLYTKLVWKKARIVRLPVLARNRRNITYEKGFSCGVGCRFNPGQNGKLIIGQNLVMGDYCQIEAMSSVKVGNNVLMASRVYIGDASHGEYKGEFQVSPNIPPNNRNIVALPIVIGDNVWIGNAVTILGGVKIGDGSIIGANAVVTKDVPKNSIAVGNLAKVIKIYNNESRKWEYD